MINKELFGGWVVIQRYSIQFRINLIHIIICKSYIEYALSSREYFSSKTFSSLSVKNIKNVSRFVFGIVRNILIDCLTINDNFYLYSFLSIFFIFCNTTICIAIF